MSEWADAVWLTLRLLFTTGKLYCSLLPLKTHPQLTF